MQVRAVEVDRRRPGVMVLVDHFETARSQVVGAASWSAVLLRLAYLTVTNTFAVLRLVRDNPSWPC